LGQLPEDLLAEFLRLGSQRRFGRGEVIIRENDRSTEVYIILSGFVRVVNHTVSGDQAVIAIRTAGDLVGEFAALDGKPRISTVIAASPTLARVVDGPRFRAFAAEHPAFSRAVGGAVVAKLRTATRLRVETGRALILTRVARVLEHLADAYGRQVSEGVLVDIPLPQRDLASLVAASEKGVGRAYRTLKCDGAIQVTHKKVLLLDRALVHHYADGGSGA
jgi:CRP-like cAMP-binding protein